MTKGMLAAIQSDWFRNGPRSAVFIGIATVFSIILYVGVIIALTVAEAPAGVDQSLSQWDILMWTILAILLAVPYMTWRWFALRNHRPIGKQWRLFSGILVGTAILNWIGRGDVIGQAIMLAFLLIAFSSTFLLSRLQNIAYAPAMMLASVAISAMIASIPIQPERGYTLYTLGTGKKVDYAFCPLGISTWCSERVISLDDPVMSTEVTMLFPEGSSIDGWKSDVHLTLKKEFTFRFRPESTVEREKFRAKFPATMRISVGANESAVIPPKGNRIWTLVRDHLIDAIAMPDSIYRIDLIEQ